MRSCVHIPHRALRFMSGAPPEMVTYLVAVLEQPAALVAPAIYVAGLLGDEVAVIFLACIWIYVVWPRLPLRLQSALLRFRDYFLPTPTSSQRDDETLDRIAELEEKVRKLEGYIKRSEDRDRGDP